MKNLSGLTFFIGLWLVGSPWELGIVHAGIAPFEAILVGLLIAFVSLFQLMCHKKKIQIGLSFALILLGLCAMSAPFVLGYSELAAALYNSLVFGGVVTGLAIVQFIKAFSLTTTGENPGHHPIRH